MLDDADNFFEALSRFQSNRMDEQRCSFGRLQKKLADEEGNGEKEILVCVRMILFWSHKGC